MATRVEPGPDSPVGDLVRWRLTTLRDDLATHVGEARRGAPDGVHQARVACRRLRAALATLRPVLDRGASDPVRAELRWLARSLGDERDCEVAHARLAELLEEQPPDAGGGPVVGQIAEHRRVARRAARSRAVEALDSPRYRELLDALDLLATGSREHPGQDTPASELLRRRVRAELDRVRRRVAVLDRLDAGPARDEALHAVRRAAKRLRYACELAEPVSGSEPARLGAAARRLTRTLGVRQDTMVTRRVLAQVAGKAPTAGEGDRTYAWLREAEQRRCAEAEAQALRALRELERPELVGWLGGSLTSPGTRSTC